MALRIGGARKLAPEPEELPETGLIEDMPVEEEEMAEEIPMEEELPEEVVEEPATGGTLDPTVAGYRGPEMGPFMCGKCQHFSAGDSTCAIVAGPVDEMGVCNIFTAMPQPEEEEVVEEEAPLEEEAPIEEEVTEEAPAEEEY